jgi:hypothetical protein
MTFRHRFTTQPEPTTSIDLLAAHISTTEAYDLDGDVREVNIPRLEPDSASWDMMPTGLSDIMTQMYGSAVFNQQSNADIFCREVKCVPARVAPLKVDIDWKRWRIPKNGGPPRPQSTEKMEETRLQIERKLDL